MAKRILRVLLVLLALAAPALVRAASVTELEGIVAAHPENLKAQFLLAKGYAAVGDNNRAIETF